MSPFSSVSFLVLALNFLNCISCWVFTDVDYNSILKKIADDVLDSENEISDDELKQLKFSLIYPGTKWCGPGNVANGYDDLGSERDTDMCCRDHDNCPDIMAAGETKWNLTNNAFYTSDIYLATIYHDGVPSLGEVRKEGCKVPHPPLKREDPLTRRELCLMGYCPTVVVGFLLNCQCDEDFRSCLHNASSNIADQIGTVYFNALGTKCFAHDFPIKGCKRRGGWFNKKCLQYSFDTKREKIVQWFDVPNF